MFLFMSSTGPQMISDRIIRFDRITQLDKAEVMLNQVKTCFGISFSSSTVTKSIFYSFPVFSISLAQEEGRKA